MNTACNGFTEKNDNGENDAVHVGLLIDFSEFERKCDELEGYAFAFYTEE